jgi:hypothetical protein
MAGLGVDYLRSNPMIKLYSALSDTDNNIAALADNSQFRQSNAGVEGGN